MNELDPKGVDAAEAATKTVLFCAARSDDVVPYRAVASEIVTAYLSASSLSEAGDGIDAAVAEVETKLPGAFWHVAKGRLSAKEPLYAAGIFFGEQELGVAETDISPAEAIRLAMVIAAPPREVK